MHTLLTTDVDRAAEMIRNGRLVAFPTETVYGVGADAGNTDAVRRIFEAKGRPADNPLIVHVWDRGQIAPLVQGLPDFAERLVDAFFPGPLTLVLPRTSLVPDVVTAGLDTVAIRMPDHPVAAAFLKAAGRPVAAPSANRSGRPSPTTWQAVRDDLGGRIDAILKGDPTRVGLESTVVDCTCAAPVVLRHGSITLDDLRLVFPGAHAADGDRAESGREGGDRAGGDRHLEGRSPGTRHRHYRPDARVMIGPVEASDSRAGSAPARAAWIGLEHPPEPGRYQVVRVVGNLDEYARSLFAFFRECEARGVDVICCQQVDERGIGRALMDRLLRAAN